jgi:SpoVK/Ycf46/Vps4 family AAA+-type ATPase
MKKWYEHETPSGKFYSPFSNSKCKTFAFDTPQELADYVNKNSSSYDIQSNNLVEIYDNTISEKKEVDIPIGVYAHEFGQPGKPERLEPMILREDKYINLLDSLKELDDEVNFFLNNREIYTNSSTIYKMGVLLFGPPGTGKTSYIREFVRKHKAIVIYLDDVPTRMFLERINEDTPDILKIFVFEEVVSRLEDANAVKEMLELLDGTMTVANSIYFMSTNFPESIPENIIRNGRVDVFVRVDFPDEEGRKKIINLYLDRNPTQDELNCTDKMPIVDIRHICFLHKKTNKSFYECAKLVEEKHKMIKKHFGKTKDIRLL